MDYPADVTTPAGRLRYYAERFPIVEADSVYYGLPTAHAPSKGGAHARGGRARREGLPAVHASSDVPASSASCCSSSRRGSSAHFAHIEECRRKLDSQQLATEFRNKTWFEGYAPQRTWRFLREQCLAHVVVDEPQGLSSSVPTVWEATCPDVAVVRLHGRNRETWERKGLKTSGDRFNYFYSDEELRELAEGVRGLSAKVKIVHVFFNNNYGDYAQRNAADFMRVV